MRDEQHHDDGDGDGDATRRTFLQAVGMSAAAVTIGAVANTAARAAAAADEKPIQGFEKDAADPEQSKDWKPISDRKIRVGLVGYGVCQFAAAFSFQDHPNVEVVAVSGIFRGRIFKGDFGRFQLQHGVDFHLLLDDLPQLQSRRLQDLQALLHLRPDGKLLGLGLIESLICHRLLASPIHHAESSASRYRARTCRKVRIRAGD